MLCIPLPILIRLHLPLKKKVVLVVLFSLGIFVVRSSLPTVVSNIMSDPCISKILSAILSKFYSFSLPFGTDWTFWYVREVGTAVIVANIPHCWVLVRRIFNVRSFLSNNNTSTSSKVHQPAMGPRVAYGNSYSGPDNFNGSQPSNPKYGMQTDIESSPGKSHTQWFKMKMMGVKSSVTETTLSRSSSEEHIIIQSNSPAVTTKDNVLSISRNNSARQKSTSSNTAQPLEIYQEVEYSVHREETPTPQPNTATNTNITSTTTTRAPDYWSQQRQQQIPTRTTPSDLTSSQTGRTSPQFGATLAPAPSGPRSQPDTASPLRRYDIPSLNGDEWKTRTIVTSAGGASNGAGYDSRPQSRS